MDLRKIAIFTIVALCGTTGVALAEKKPKVAILGLEVVAAGGMDAKIVKLATNLTVALRKRASRGAGPYKLEAQGNKDLLEMKLLGGCDAKETLDCMAGIGNSFNVDVMIYGKLQQRKKGYQVSVNLLDVKKKRMIRTKSELIGLDDTSPARINEWARRLYNRLTGVPEQGKIVVKANVQTGQVFINGEIKGALADGRREITGVAEGTMEVRIESDGHVPFSTEVTVKGGKTAEITANLAKQGSVVPPKPKKPGSTARVLFWSTAVVAASGAVVATVTGLQVAPAVQEKEDAIAAYRMANDDPDAFSGNDACTDARSMNVTAIVDACAKGENNALIANVMGGVALVSAAAAGFFYYKGYIQPKSAKSGDTTVVFTPTVLPSYVGAGVKIEF